MLGKNFVIYRKIELSQTYHSLELFSHKHTQNRTEKLLYSIASNSTSITRETAVQRNDQLRFLQISSSKTGSIIHYRHYPLIRPLDIVHSYKSLFYGDKWEVSCNIIHNLDFSFEN